ncbi:MAG: hypothetical protein O6913_01910 [Chloroflexi bacterium]|nr:hypothetical protein [Chloroflexota bacterium]
MSPALLSRSVRRFRLPLALVLLALLLAACGGGGPGDAAPTTDRGERAERPARSDSAETADVDTPAAGQSSQAQQASETAAAPDFPLDRVFVEVVGIEGFGLLNVVSAQPAVELLVGLVQPDGTPWDPFELADELGLIGVYGVVYTTFDPESLVVATIEVARFADARGAERLLEIVRTQPLGAGETVVTLAPGLQLAGAFANTHDTTVDPQAGVFAAVASVYETSVVVVQGRIALRTIVLRGGTDEVLSVQPAALLARQQLDRLTQARAGDLQPVMFVPVPRFNANQIADRLPAAIGDFQRLNSAEGDPSQALVRYGNASGDFIVAVIIAYADAGEIRVTDFAILEGGGLLIFTGAGTAFDILDAAQFEAPSLPGVLGSSARWQVLLDQQVLWDDVLAFRLGTIWTILQGISVDPGATPILELGFLIEEAIGELAAQP